MKGTRVQSIIRELRGEKIDIVEWSEDPAGFVVNALSPAKVSRVSIVDEEQKIMEVVVEDKQLSLAIGKKGQNVRLAAKLVGWRIDIKSEEEKRQEVEAEMARMARVVDEVRSLTRHGVAEETVQRLVDAGVGGLAHLLEMPDEELVDVAGIEAQDAREDPRGRGAGRIEWDEQDAAAEAERLAAEQAAADQAAADQAADDQAAADQAAADQAADRLRPTRPLPSRTAAEAAAAADAAEAGAEPAGTAAGEEEGTRMANVRVFSLARDLKLTSQEVIDRLKKLGVDAKTASSSVDEDTADKLRRALKIDALAERKKRVYGSDEDEAERERIERELQEKVAAERAERERAAEAARAAAEARKTGRRRPEPEKPAETTPPALAHAPGAPRLAPKSAHAPAQVDVDEMEPVEAEEPQAEEAFEAPEAVEAEPSEQPETEPVETAPAAVTPAAGSCRSRSGRSRAHHRHRTAARRTGAADRAATAPAAAAPAPAPAPVAAAPAPARR